MCETVKLIEQLNTGAYDDAIKKLYCTNANEIILKQRQRYCDAVQEFSELYGADREVRVYSVPGRTEIGGNHTDHNNGVVMAAAVNLDIIAVVAQSGNGIVRVTSKGFGKEDIINLNILTPQPSEDGRSSSLIRGVAKGFLNRGGKIGGFDAFTTSDVLRGSGLSSSAAFEVMVGAIFNGEFNNNKFSAVEIAQISQYAENIFFKKPSGLMDQTACAVGGAITIDFKNPDMPVVNRVEFNLSKYDYSLCITDTKGSHADLTEDYAAIRTEMENVAMFFGKNVLREVEEGEFYKNINQIRKKCGDRAVLRAIHFYAECKRAQNLCDAVQQDRFSDFLSLIIDGGHSSFEYNQNAYSIKKPHEQGVALGVALSQQILDKKGAWRLQGGGFAGTIQAFVPNYMLHDYRELMENVFGIASCHVLSVRNYGAICIDCV